MATTSYGSITIVDITDVGELTLQIKSNLPTSVIYNPNNTGQEYDPNWYTNNLVLEPIVYYAGNPVSLSNSDLTVTWKVKAGTGSSSPTTIVDGQDDYDITNKILTVENNKLAPNSTPNGYEIITYYAVVEYDPTELGLDNPISITAEKSFTLTTQAAYAPSCRITGQNIFKLNAAKTAAIGSSTIDLTFVPSFCRFGKWEYWNGTTWVTTGLTQSSTLTISWNGNYFINGGDTAIFKATAKHNTLNQLLTDVYDEFTVSRLADGVAGTNIYTMDLSNDDQLVPVSRSTGNVDYSAATTNIYIVKGNINDYSHWNISISPASTPSTGSPITYTLTTDTTSSGAPFGVLQVSNMTADLVTLQITATPTSPAEDRGTLYKTFTIQKAYPGQDGLTPTIYSIEPSVAAVTKTSIYNASGQITGYSYNPNPFRIYTYKWAENISTHLMEKDLYTDTGAYLRVYKSSANTTIETIKSGTAPAADLINGSSTSIAGTGYVDVNLTSIGNVSSLIAAVYNSSNTLLDIEGISMAPSGPKGEDGETGESVFTISFSNPFDGFSTTADGYTVGATTVELPFHGYYGTHSATAELISSPIPQLHGQSYDSTNSVLVADSTTDYEGNIKYNIPNNTLISNTSGVNSYLFELTYDTFTVQIQVDYTWTVNRDGKNAVVLRIEAPNGDTFYNDDTTPKVLNGYLKDGGDVITGNAARWKWTVGSSYNTQKSTSQSYTVQATDVDGYLPVRLQVEYPARAASETFTPNYVEYYSMYDKGDPLQVSVHCTLGEKLVNGQGAGALYARVIRKDSEIDAIGNAQPGVGTSDPTGGSNGDTYIKINESNKTATLWVKKNGSWAEMTLAATYEWTFRDDNNSPITNAQELTTKFGDSYNSTTGKVTGKCLYVDRNVVDNKLTADVKVTYPTT